MDPRLQELLDHHEIRKLQATYCFDVDRLDSELIASVYMEESWDDHGPYKGPGPEFARTVAVDIGEQSTMSSHQLGQSMITVRGDEAGAETYFIASMRRNDKIGQEFLDQMGGRYVDTLEREAGTWKIKTRVCIREWSISHRVTEDWLEGRQFPDGLRSQQDPAFAALGLRHSGQPRVAARHPA